MLLRLRTGDGELALISTVTTFGTALDITAAELSIEAFLPADDTTAETLRRLATDVGPPTRRRARGRRPRPGCGA